MKYMIDSRITELGLEKICFHNGPPGAPKEIFGVISNSADWVSKYVTQHLQVYLL